MIKNLHSRRDVLQTAALGSGALAAGMALPSLSRAAGKTLTPVNIIKPSEGMSLVFQQMVVERGYMTEFGLEPHFTDVVDGSKAMGALISGEMDIAVQGGFQQVPTAIEKGARLKVIAGGVLLCYQCVFAKDPAIKTVKDLEGKTIGVGSLGALLHQLMVALLESKGVDVKTVKFANIGSNQNVFKAVIAGVVDAGPTTIDVYNRQQQYGVHSLEDGEFWAQLPQYTQNGYYASDEAIATKRDMLIGVLAAYGKLYRFIQQPESKEAFIKARRMAMGSAADDSDSEFEWNWFQKYKPLDSEIILSEARMNYIQKLNVEFGAQETILPFEKVADMSLARAAAKLLT